MPQLVYWTVLDLLTTYGEDIMPKGAPLPQDTTAVVGVPAPDGINLNQIAGGAAGNPLMAIILGAVAVLGGKKVWDFWKQKQELAHEEKMKQLEIQASAGAGVHAECEAKRKDLEASVAALKFKAEELEQRCAKAEKKLAASFDEDAPSTTDLDATLKKLAKRVKSLEDSAADEDEDEDEKPAKKPVAKKPVKK